MAPATQRAYTINMNRFLSHTRLSLLQLYTRRSSSVDRLLAAYLDHSYESGGSFDYASQTFFGLLHHCPHLRNRLGESRLRLRGWANIRVTRSHPPLTWELTVLFAVTMASWSHHAEAVGMLLSFDCYLRVGELTRLTAADVMVPNDARHGAALQRTSIRLGVTKTGRNQAVTLQNENVATVLQRYMISLGDVPSTSRIFPFSPARLRTLLRTVAVSHGLGAIPYVPHSLRHGGATTDYLRGRSIEQIMQHGRWKSMESAQRYIQQGHAVMGTIAVPTALNNSGAAYARVLVETIDTLRVDRPAPVSTTPASSPRRRRRGIGDQ